MTSTIYLAFVLCVYSCSAASTGSEVDITANKDGTKVHAEGNAGTAQNNSASAMNIQIVNVVNSGCCPGEEEPTTTTTTTTTTTSTTSNTTTLPIEKINGQGHWIMAVGGRNETADTDDVEVLSLQTTSYQVPTCLSRRSPLPTALVSAYGAVINGANPMVCKGRSPPEFREKCFSYDPLADSWQEIANTHAGRLSNAGVSVHLDDPANVGLLVTGGYDGSYYTNKVFTTRDGIAVDTTYPNLPEGVMFHCQVKLDEDTVLLLGGITGANTFSARVHRLRVSVRGLTNDVTTMPKGRSGHFCGKAGSVGTADVVVVAGGRKAGPEHIRDVDILTISTMRWTTGNPLPFRWDFPATVPYGSTFVALGGFRDITTRVDLVYRYNRATDSWILLPARLSQPKAAVTAFQLFDTDFARC